MVRNLQIPCGTMSSSCSMNSGIVRTKIKHRTKKRQINPDYCHQGKQFSKMAPAIRLEVYGLVNDVNFQRARFCAEVGIVTHGVITQGRCGYSFIVSNLHIQSISCHDEYTIYLLC
jgi:hypothetical protein